MKPKSPDKDSLRMVLRVCEHAAFILNSGPTVWTLSMKTSAKQQTPEWDVIFTNFLGFGFQSSCISGPPNTACTPYVTCLVGAPASPKGAGS